MITLTFPVSSSSVTNMTPFAVPCRNEEHRSEEGQGCQEEHCRCNETCPFSAQELGEQIGIAVATHLAKY
ncbi:hypothetical protein [Caballeronia sp. LZ043]|uniref:hypothetical protein n=1 Tax=Caballeronia sp. LZ043 TaxID=3038569 RepID=UPI00285EAD68|nr:hypothetical protein [Caballeronia sp. LZ043]MDR5822489.1 hypothetical protein [Caballeronia sp. LZ043]